ncbi:MAG: Hsp20/alpha crystallin family protein [Gemmatimonadota bacterium]
MKEERDDFYRSERSYGRFYRALPLPEGVDEKQVHASFKAGMLEITVPAPIGAERERKHINIE